jgi:hypothetical protein
MKTLLEWISTILFMFFITIALMFFTGSPIISFIAVMFALVSLTIGY